MPAPRTTETASAVDPTLIAAIVKATTEAVRLSTQMPENRNPPSADWNGWGLPDFPKLRWESVYFCGAKLRDRELTRDETKLLNLITTPGLYGDEKIWEVKIREKTLDLRVKGIQNIEVRLSVPSFKHFLQQIVDEQNAVAV